MEQPFCKCIWYIFKMMFQKSLLCLRKIPFRKQQLQPIVAFPKEYFVSSRKYIVESTILAYGRTILEEKIAIQKCIFYLLE